MKKMALLFITLLISGFMACTSTPEATPSEPVTLHFTYWGTDIEKVAIENMAKKFEAANPDIKINAQHIPDAEYQEQLSAMDAQGNLPDLGYLGIPLEWANEGKILDITDYVQNDSELSSRLSESYYYYKPNRTIGTNTAGEIIIMYYNKDLFDQAGLPYPPSDPQNAWTWEEFLQTAIKLTTDVNGNHPTDPDFNPDKIAVYGVNFFPWWGGYYPFIYSNGGQIVNEDGTELLLDSPEAIEAIQRLSDLMWVHHVAPTPAQRKNLPPQRVMLQTGQLAMDFNGYWRLIDYSKMEGLNFDVAVLPKMKEPKTIFMGSPTVIFANTQHIEAAIKFYKFHNNPEAVDLFAQGLWMPLQKAYYTNPDKTAAWIDNDTHPAGTKGAIVNYAQCCMVRVPLYYVKDFGSIADQVIQPQINRVWDNELTAAEALPIAVKDANALLHGRWDK